MDDEVQGLWVKTDGTIHTIKAENADGTFTLKQVQEAVGGYVEIVRDHPGEAEGLMLLVNEDGLHERLPKNETMTAETGKLIVGNALVIPEGSFK